MKIDKLYLKDFRGFHDLDINFNAQSTIFFGINGVGKSSVLAAVNLLYAIVINKIVKQRFKQSINMDIKDIKVGKASAMIEGEFAFNGEDRTYPLWRKIDYENQRLYSQPELSRLYEYYENRYVGKAMVDEDNNLILHQVDYNLPVFVNYGVNRLVLKTPLRIPKRPDYQQYAAFENAIESKIQFERLFEWFLEQEVYENQKKKNDDTYRDAALEAVKTAMLAMLDGFYDIHIEAHPYSMKVTKVDRVLDILQLSDGEKCTLALFGDLARRLAIANPSLANPLMGEGVVLIDEIELHMHTQWQRKVISVLNDTFPNIQFIITTHSPQILGEVPESFKVFSLYQENNESLCSCIASPYGLDSNSVLEELLQTDHINAEIKKQTDEMYRYIDDKQYDEAEKTADQIDRLTCHRNIDTARARIMIDRGRRRNASN